MATEVKIPSLGESISSGILAAWHVSNGDYVEQGQSLFDLETDKITSEGNAEVSGTIELKADEGEEVEVGSVVALIDENAGAPENDDTASREENADTSDSGNKTAPKRDATSDREEASDSEAAPETYPASVRRLAEESGIDPRKVSGSGKAGRVTKGDMLEAIEKAGEDKAAPASPEATPSAAPASTERESRRKMSPLRKTIARRLVQAQQESAMLTTFNEVDMSAVMRIRKTHQEAFVGQHGLKLGFMSFFTKAAVRALKAWPGINARIDGDEIVSNHYYDIGIAVSTPKGLLVPVIRDCESKSFAAIERDILDFAGKAKEGKISIEDLQGGVFTITNGGIFGSMLSTPILNSPQSGILGMHTIQERPVAVDGSVVIRPMMYLAHSYDHRLVDGREAVGFLVSVKEAIEDPMRLMFEI
ncbi:MAG TPA: 2-oxoglutarate dehydrogenase complex dihydrolipoyllysine-residue succinyltransferase [Oceanipulchritudo sp.]|nr:2-oxoglutarate dehydrogenase complex dihydrolipoyllysine-residue succinyltransferase [Oceanipulchritudo sp.]